MTAIRIVDGRPAVLRETTGERLRRLRMAKGWTQMELAIRAGVTQRSISDIELDKSSPTLWLFNQIANALDTCICYLYAGGAGCKHEEAAS